MIRLLRSNPDLRALFFGQVISFMGDWFTFVALTGIIKEATDSEFLVSLAYVSFTLPAFLATPVSGSMVDRFDRRRLVIVVSMLQAVAAVGLLTATTARVWPLFVFQGAISALAAVVKPAIDAGVPNLARSPEELRAANVLFGSTWGVMLAVGAAVGGAFSETFGRQAAFIADAASFVIAVGLFALIRRPMQEARAAGTRSIRPFADMSEAIRYAREDKAVLALLASKGTFAIGAGTVSQLPVLATAVYGWKDGGTGLLFGARGVGTGLGPLIAARFTKGDLSKVLRICGLAGIAFSICYLAAAWSPTIFMAAALIGVAHLGGGAQWTLSTYGLQLRTPDHIRGRVMAGDYAILTLTLSVTAMAAGLLAELAGVRWTITAFAGAAAFAGFAYLLLTRGVVTSAAKLGAGDAVDNRRQGGPHATARELDR
ncbi:MAG: MFS transporter [Actinobacteria bacterium]|nr:MFS transporter [Actinomycetota bacterium]